MPEPIRNPNKNKAGFFSAANMEALAEAQANEGRRDWDGEYLGEWEPNASYADYGPGPNEDPDLPALKGRERPAGDRSQLFNANGDILL